MPLHAHDALTPRGRLHAATLWPGRPMDEVESALEEYLIQGYASADVLSNPDLDDAALEWAYYRAYDEVYQTRLAMPSSVDTGKGSSSYLLTQIEHIGALAREARARFDGLVASAVPVVLAAPVTRMSACVPARFVW